MNGRRAPLLLRRAVATLGAGLLLAAGSVVVAAPAAAAPPSATPSAGAPVAAAPPAAVTGTACQPGQGVTIGVDFDPVTDEVRVGCAVGEQATMAAAGAAAGFSFAPTTGFLTTIDGVVSPATGYWSVYITTADGNPGGALTQTWTFAQTGIDGGPLAVDTMLLFDLVPDMNAPEQMPRISPAELTAATADSTGASESVSVGGGAAPSSATAAAPAAESGSSSTVWLVVLAVLILAALAAAAVVISRRRSARSDD